MVERLDYLTETALAKVRQDFIAIGNMVTGNSLVVGLVIIIGRDGEEFTLVVDASEIDTEVGGCTTTFLDANQFVDLERRQLVFEVKKCFVDGKTNTTCSVSLVDVVGIRNDNRR